MQVRRSMVSCVTAAASIAAVLFAGQIASSGVVSAAAPTSWLTTVNAYRAMSGLGPVTENTTWSAEASGALVLHALQRHLARRGPRQPRLHHRWRHRRQQRQRRRQQQQRRNRPQPHRPLDVRPVPRDRHPAPPAHDERVRHLRRRISQRMAVRRDARRAPRHQLTRSPARPRRPSFPGRNATLALEPLPHRVAQPAHVLRLVRLRRSPADRHDARRASRRRTQRWSARPGRSQTCVLHGENTNGTAQSILRSDNAVVVVPREPLAPGTYTSTVTSTGGDVTWSFTIDPNAELQAPSIVLPDTAPASARSTFEPVAPYRYADSRVARKVVRILAGAPTTVDFGDPTITAVSANFTVDGPSAAGFLTVYNCSAAVPVVSTLNFTASAVPNQAFVALSQGRLCLFSPVDTDIIIDVNGYFRAGLERQLLRVRPGRTEAALRHPAGRRPRPRGRRARARSPSKACPAAPPPTPTPWRSTSPSSPRPATASSGPTRATRPASSEVSNVNFEPLENRPNSAIIPTSASGTICVVSNAADRPARRHRRLLRRRRRLPVHPARAGPVARHPLDLHQPQPRHRWRNTRRRPDRAPRTSPAPAGSPPTPRRCR